MGVSTLFGESRIAEFLLIGLKSLPIETTTENHGKISSAFTKSEGEPKNLLQSVAYLIHFPLISRMLQLHLKGARCSRKRGGQARQKGEEIEGCETNGTDLPYAACLDTEYIAKKRRVLRYLRIHSNGNRNLLAKQSFLEMLPLLIGLQPYNDASNTRIFNKHWQALSSKECVSFFPQMSDFCTEMRLLMRCERFVPLASKVLNWFCLRCPEGKSRQGRNHLDFSPSGISSDGERKPPFPLLSSRAKRRKCYSTRAISYV